VTTQLAPTTTSPPAPVWSPDLTTEAGMDDEARSVFRALYPSHQGRAHAASRDDLAGETRLDDRRLRDTIGILVERHGIPIYSAVRPPYGYYIAATEEEIADAYRTLRSYALSILRRMGRLGRIVPERRRREIQCEINFPGEIFRA
jgi:hypothetical protein